MVEKLLEDLSRAHDGLQHLHIEATKSNVAIIWDALQALENANAFIKDLMAASAKQEEGVTDA